MTMLAFVSSYTPLFDLVLIYSLIALSQYVSFRGGVLSLAPAGFTLIGAYTGAIMIKSTGLGAMAGICASIAMGACAGLLLALPLARLRGVFPAIATIGFVQIVVSLALYAEPLTGGAVGLTAIPKVATTPCLVAALAAVVGLLSVINRSNVGSAFDAIRQDVTVAESLGIRVAHYYRVNFALSGAIGAVAGCLLAYNTYAITPEEFGFGMLVFAATAVILGGRSSIAGAIIGTAILLVLPELARPLHDQRLLMQGALLIVIITYLPQGIVDTARELLRQRRSVRHPVVPARKVAA